MSDGGSTGSDSGVLTMCRACDEWCEEEFCYGMRSAFNHKGRFDDFEDFETWLYGEWDDYRETRI